MSYSSEKFFEHMVEQVEADEQYFSDRARRQAEAEEWEAYQKSILDGEEHLQEAKAALGYVQMPEPDLSGWLLSETDSERRKKAEAAEAAFNEATASLELAIKRLREINDFITLSTAAV